MSLRVMSLQHVQISTHVCRKDAREAPDLPLATWLGQTWGK